jgi:hypothetical protein
MSPPLRPFVGRRGRLLRWSVIRSVLASCEIHVATRPAPGGPFVVLVAGSRDGEQVERRQVSEAEVVPSDRDASLVRT